MLKSILILPDGRELSSGAEAVQPLMWVRLTESVNDNEELTMGAAFANILEAKIHTYQKPMALTAGDEIVLYKEDGLGLRHRIGCFILDKPTCLSPDTVELRGFDRVIKLNRDLTQWLKELEGWPYRLIDFAGMVCDACGLELVTDTVPNGDFLVQPFAAEVTGYQLMRWIGEICCRFCRANADGKIELAWYNPAGVSITPSGNFYFLQDSLRYEAYEVAPVDAVQLRLADDEAGALWPQVPEGANSYIIESNPILRACVSEALLPVLENIRQTLPQLPYRPFRVSVPAGLDIHAGDTVQITDQNGVSFTAPVMSREQEGQKETLECTGSPRRDSVTARYEMTEQEKTAALKSYADSAAGSAKAYTDAQNERLDQQELLKRLTNEWGDDGIYLDAEGRLAINASAILSGSIVSEGQAYLPPTRDDAMTMLWSLSYPDRYPPKDFYDLNGDGVFDRDDVTLAMDVYLGKIDISTCPGANKTNVTVTIEPSNPKKAVLISGTNMWGSEVAVYLGTGGSNIPIIAGDCSVGGKLAVGEYAILQSLATDVEQEPKKLSWKKISGVNTLIGYEDEEPEVQSVATLYSGTLNSGSVSLAGGYSRFVIVGYTDQNQCKVSLTVPAAACDGSLFQLYADGAWVSFSMSEDALTISKVSNGGAVTGIYGII